MTKLDIYGGLLGAGKTTLIRRMLSVVYAGFKTAVIENEAGKVNLDAEMLKSASISVREISSGCICCTVRGAFAQAAELLAEQEKPDYIVVEASGLADLSGVISACTESKKIRLNRVIMVVNASRFLSLRRVVGDFYTEQLQAAGHVYLSFTEKMDGEKLEQVKRVLREIHPGLAITEKPLNGIAREDFPEGEEIPGNRRNAKESSLLVSEGLESAEKFGRIRAGGKREAVSWCWEFSGSFDEEDARGLMEIFRSGPCSELWRVKGCLKMKDGKVRKIDLAFGDSFQEELRDFPEDKRNLFVAIGGRRSILELNRRLAERFEADAGNIFRLR